MIQFNFIIHVVIILIPRKIADTFKKENYDGT